MGDTSGFYKMYLIPGMLHCAGGVGPSNVDWVSLLDGLGERQEGAGRASIAMGGPGTGGGGPASQVLLLPSAGVAKKAGESWACSVRSKKEQGPAMRVLLLACTAPSWRSARRSMLRVRKPACGRSGPQAKLQHRRGRGRRGGGDQVEPSLLHPR